jgi:hypothetical protein
MLPTEVGAESMKTIAIVILGCVWYQVGYSQGAFYDFFPVYDGMKRTYFVVKEYRYDADVGAMRLYEKDSGFVLYTVRSHQRVGDEIRWAVDAAFSLAHHGICFDARNPDQSYDTSWDVHSSDTVVIAEQDTGRHELRSYDTGVSSIVGAWRFPVYVNPFNTKESKLRILRFSPDISDSSITYKDPTGSIGCRYTLESRRNPGMIRLAYHWWRGAMNFEQLYYTATLIDPSRDNTLSVNSPSELAYSLDQNFPNPAVSKTGIRYCVPPGEKGEILVFDLFGRQVARIRIDDRSSGAQEWTVDVSHLKNGFYAYRLECRRNAIGRMMTVLH